MTNKNAKLSHPLTVKTKKIFVLFAQFVVPPWCGGREKQHNFSFFLYALRVIISFFVVLGFSVFSVFRG